MQVTEDIRKFKIEYYDFRSLEITFRMASPICLTYPFIFFDGMIAHLMNRYLDPEGYRALPSKRVVKKVGEVSLPIKRYYFNDKEYIYHASVSIFDQGQAYVTTIYKRFYEKYLDFNRIKRKKIDRSRGFFRDYMIKLVYIPARKVTFYACGDAEALDVLFQGLPGLGKKTAIGFGSIKDYSIKEINEDYSIVKDGMAMRSIPAEAVKWSSEIVLMAYKAPYWAKENVKPCVPPFALVKFNNRVK